MKYFIFNIKLIEYLKKLLFINEYKISKSDYFVDSEVNLNFKFKVFV